MKKRILFTLFALLPSCVLASQVTHQAPKEVVREFEKKNNGKVQYAFEARQGLSYARNKGIGEARGEIVVFTDDDVIADKCWVSSLYKAFKDYSADCVGGKILPIWSYQD